MGSMILRPWVVVLAAGGSRRFGAAKLLARIGGESLLGRSVRAALGSQPAGCVVVLGSRARDHARELRGFPVRIALNDHWRRGLAGSIRAGLASLPAGARAALLLLADQAQVGPAELALLAAAWRQAPSSIVASSYDGVLGPPAIFPRRSFPLLRRLRGDAGARALLAGARHRVIAVEVPAAGLDVDRLSDLRRLRRRDVLS